MTDYCRGFRKQNEDMSDVCSVFGTVCATVVVFAYNSDCDVQKVVVTATNAERNAQFVHCDLRIRISYHFPTI